MPPHSVLFIKPDVVHQFSDKRQQQGTVIIFKDSYFSKNKNAEDFLRKLPLFSHCSTYVLVKLGDDHASFESTLHLIEIERQNAPSKYHIEITRHFLINLFLFAERKLNTTSHGNLNPSAEHQIAHQMKDLIESIHPMKYILITLIS